MPILREQSLFSPRFSLRCYTYLHMLMARALRRATLLSFFRQRYERYQERGFRLVMRDMMLPRRALYDMPAGASARYCVDAAPLRYYVDDTMPRYCVTICHTASAERRFAAITRITRCAMPLTVCYVTR